MKYKVGDKITVRDDLITGESYGGCDYIELMSAFLAQNKNGRVLTVRAIDEYGYMAEECFWCWTDEMLES